MSEQLRKFRFTSRALPERLLQFASRLTPPGSPPPAAAFNPPQWRSPEFYPPHTFGVLISFCVEVEIFILHTHFHIESGRPDVTFRRVRWKSAAESAYQRRKQQV
jgi:hypothetical protein